MKLLLYYEVPLGEFRAGFENHGRPVGTRQIGALRRAGSRAARTGMESPHSYLIVDLANHHANAADAIVLLPA
jgi:hypothetical protein